MKRKIKVAVLMGGKSAEHEISLMTGREVVKNLDSRKYDILPIVVSRDGITWQIGQKEKFLLQPPAKRSQETRVRSQSVSKTDQASIIKSNHVDIVFIAMHGPNGEDGTVQGFLELLGVPYTGSKVLASALGMDKVASRKIFKEAGLTVPDYQIARKGQKISINIELPLFVKPHNQGSSVGTSFARDQKNLKKALNLAWQYSDLALVEEYIEGVEVTASILGNESPRVLPLTEIVPKKDFFDYEAKYNENLCEEIIPARISQQQTKKAQEAGLRAYKAIGCRGFGRVDIIIKGNYIYVLEVNTIPGLTPVSLFPKAAEAAGISYPKLLNTIINCANP